MANMTTLLHNHTESLEYASSTAFAIHHNLEQAANAARSWNQTLSLGSTIADYGLRISCPIASIFLGNYGLPPSLTRNAALVLGGKLRPIFLDGLSDAGLGYGVAETIVQIRHTKLSWSTCIWLWNPLSITAVKQLPLSSTDIPEVDFSKPNPEHFTEFDLVKGFDFKK